MANFALSVLNTGQAKVTAQFQEPEQRRKIPSALGLALQNQNYSIPDAVQLRTSPLRPVSVFFRKDIAAGSATTKAYNHTGTFGDSGSTTVTYVSHVETIGVPLKIGANNVYSYQDVFNDAYAMAWKNLRTRHDNSALAFLYANRAQLTAAVMNPLIQSAGLSGQWNDTTFALELTDAQKSLFIQKVKDFMYARNYRGELDVLADIQMSSNFMNYINQGTGNFANTSWQFDGVNIAKSQSVLDANYSAGSVFAMPKGMLAGLNWNEQLNRTGIPSPDMGAIGMVGTQVDPMGSGAIADVSMYRTRADTSANGTGGSTQDFILQTELTLTIGYVTAPLTLASDSPIHEVSQAGGVS